MITRSIGVPVFVVFALHTSLVSAQPVATTPPAAPPELAPSDPGDVAFERGLAALRERRFADAQPALAEALRLQPTPMRLYNLGLADRGLGHYVEAIDLFQQYLAAPEAEAVPARLAAISAAVEAMRQSLAHLVLHATPTDVVVRVDGRTVTVPADGGLAIDPRAHVVELTAAGYEPERREVSAAAGEQVVVQVELRREERARLIVEPSVATAVVSIDSAVAGTGSVERRLRAGVHVVEVTAEGYRPQRQSVLLSTLGVARVPITLQRLGRPAWVLPVIIAGGAAVVGGAIVTGLWLTRGTADPISGAWGTYRESIELR